MNEIKEALLSGEGIGINGFSERKRKERKGKNENGEQL